ncbi:MAG: type IV pilus assembly protein PilM [Planctomycetota bacterium]
MASSNVCWGVEIGAGAIKAVKLELDGDQVVASDFAVIPHPKVLSTPEIDEADVLRVSMGKLVASKDLAGAPLAVSIPGHQSFARFAKLPPVDPKTVKNVVKYEAQQQVPYPLEDVEWDYQTFQNPDSPEVEVGIFAVARARIMERLQLLNDLGLTPEIVTLSPVAAYNAMAHDLEFTEDTPGTIILDIGTTASDLIIAEKGGVWVRTFQIGGHRFTEALVDQFKLSYSKAERLKKDAESSKHARHVFQAMRPIFTDLVHEVQQSIGFYQSVHEGAKLQRLVGVGSTLKLPGLRKYLKQQLQMDVYRLENFKKIRAAEEAVQEEFEEASINLLTATGLALQGLGQVPLRANVMPVSVLRESMWKRKRGFFGIAAGVAAATAAAAFVRPVLDQAEFSSSSVPPEVQRVVRTSNQLKNEATDAGVIGGEQTDLRGAQLLDLLNERDLYTKALADATAVINAGMASAEAEEVREGGKVIQVRSIMPRFASPGGGGGGGGRRGGGGGGGGGFPGFGGPPQNQPQQPQTGGEEKVDVAGLRRVEIDLTFETDHPDPVAFATNAMVGWLKANQTRAGVAHTIVNAEVVTGTNSQTSGSAGSTTRPNIPRGAAGGPGVGINPIRILDSVAPLRPEESAPQPGAPRNPRPGIGVTGGQGSQQEDRIVTVRWVMALDPVPGVSQ